MSLRTRGRPAKIYKCELCMKVLKSRQNFIKHLKRHEKIQCHICHLCGRGFVLSHELRRHVSKKLFTTQHSQKRSQLEEAYQRLCK